MTKRRDITPAMRQQANDFLHWRQARGGAVRWDRGGAAARRRNRERRDEIASTGLMPIDSFLLNEGVLP
ncbi:hypothetical protein [Kaistia nematophila]|uniref:Uncharacterized protein n=1 Tax=Kaistia nematophila TaxID=2994654 RepID=A0A9X3E3L3_9HYPH|nr:hypothetical protein [Kaistia nematophila]MCX5570586.1 hypothetical protein [Kaistia nematophila]